LKRNEGEERLENRSLLYKTTRHILEGANHKELHIIITLKARGASPTRTLFS